jgi:hypothetical protein
MTNKMIIKSAKRIESFYFHDAGAWEALPGWVEFFVDLGTALANVETDSQSLVLAVATPTRAFAANLIALGLISARSGIKQQVSLDQHFEMLSNLKPGTVVQFLEKGKKCRANFIAIEFFMGEQGAKIKLQMPKNAMTRFIPKRFCQKIMICYGSQQVEKATSRKLDIIHRPNFTAHFLDTVSPIDFALQQRLDCRIIGRQNILKLEAKSDVFAVKNEGNLDTGNLNDVLRVRSIIRSGDPFRTEILTSRNGDHPEVQDEIPHVTIYDGSCGFLKFGMDNRQPIRVAVLDRTEPNYAVAAQNVSDMFVNRRTSEVELRLNHYQPDGVDILAFMEAKI